jgi:hypothetical protein
MKKNLQILTFSLTAIALATLSGCKDPIADFLSSSEDILDGYLAKSDSVELDGFYYIDMESLRAVSFEKGSDGTYTSKYLGLLNINNFSFSNVASGDYFFDLGNVNVDIDIENNKFSIPDYIDENGNFLLDKFLDNPPFVLLKKDEDGSYKEFGGLSSDKTLIAASDPRSYDPTLFFINGFEYKVNDQLSFDYTGSALALLKRDILEIIYKQLDEAMADLPKFLDISKGLKSSYKKVNNLSSEEEVPSTVKIPGEVYLNGKAEKVVVGPMAMTSLYTSAIGDDYTPYINEVAKVEIGEGVEEIAPFAFYKAVKLKDVTFPKSLNAISATSLSLLSLDTLYVANTATPIDFFGINLGTITSGDTSMDILPALEGTTIGGNLIFEDLHNSNISSFPYSDLANDDDEPIAEKIAIGSDGEKLEFSTLKEALDSEDEVSAILEITHEGGIVTSGELSSIPQDKVVYLEPSFTDLLADNSRLYNNDDTAFSIDPSLATLTLKLEGDLEVGGTIYLGGTVGFDGSKSGDIAGIFSAIDLNGHNLTIDGGQVYANGLIYDSSANSGGNLIVKNGGVLTTNFVIYDFYGNSNASLKLNQGESPYLLWNIPDIRATLSIEDSGILKGIRSYIDVNGETETLVPLIGNGSDGFLFVLSSGSKAEIKYLSSGRQTINITGDISIETPSALEDQYQDFKDVLFPIVSKYLSLTVSGDTSVTQAIKILPDGVLTTGDLTLYNEVAIYDRNDQTGVENYPDLDSSNDGSVLIAGTLSSGASNNPAILGSLVADDETSYNVMKTYLKGMEKKKESYFETAIDNSSNQLKTVYIEDLSAKLTWNEKSFYTDEDDTYYEKNGSDYYLKKSSDDKVLASSSSTDTEWKADTSSYGWVDTGVSKDTDLTNFTYTTSSESFNYFLKDGSRFKASAENSDHTYTIDGELYISLNGTLRKGSFISNSTQIFKVDNDGRVYFYFEGSSTSKWEKVTYYENERIISNPNGMVYYYLTGTSNEFAKADSYSQTGHYFKSGGETYIYPLSASTPQQTLNDIYYKSDSSSYFYVDGSWKIGNVYTAMGQAVIDENQSTEKQYYFGLENDWVSGSLYSASSSDEIPDFVSLGESGHNYNGTNYYYGMLDDKTSADPNFPYNKVLTYISLMGEVNVTEQDYSEIWPEEASDDSYKAYRYYKDARDGKLYLFTKEDGKIIKKRFTFASGFTLKDAGMSDSNNPVSKYDFIQIKVRFDGDNADRTLYLSLDSEDIVGEADDSDHYLAFGVYTTENPVDSLT